MKYIIDGNVIKTEVPLDFEAILTCGQTFRFVKTDSGYDVFSGEYKCSVSGDKIGTDMPEYFVNYFDLDTDYNELMSTLSKFDELKSSLEFGKGIRILRQNLFEVIISFIISANNNIPRIKGIIERICAYSGRDMGGYYAFPTPQQLVRVTKDEFRSLGAGFRDAYLSKSAQILAETDFMDRLLKANTEEATKLLLSLPGVGPKVADCILLFGLRKWDSFPVDTWIFKQCSTEELNTPNKVREFYLSRYGSLAGLAQQYIFYGAREK
ncbi:MAG: 8-oxoguanine DNA glycosylase [Clostridiales bacterium]|nr:8-oxoguanine DNA glycosylase [Clostridiales bacterium]